jgi:hypothetical protein
VDRKLNVLVRKRRLIGLSCTSIEPSQCKVRRSTMKGPAVRYYQRFIIELFLAASCKVLTMAIPSPNQTTRLHSAMMRSLYSSRIHDWKSNACIRPIYRTSSSSICRLLLCRLSLFAMYVTCSCTLFPAPYLSRSNLRIFLQHVGHLHGVSIIFICALRCSLCRIYTSLETYSTAKGAIRFVSTGVYQTGFESQSIIPRTYKGRAERRLQARRRRSERREPPAA